jgi:CRISPR-associated protein Cas5d
MGQFDSLVLVKVSGPLAVFTRPEMKVERVSYPVMTPSAARGVLESVFWKPEFQWIVQEIQVLKPVEYFSVLRNEVNSPASDRAARGWERAGGVGGFFAPDDRTQRHTLALRDVAYVIRADAVVRPGSEHHPEKYRDQFRRRVERGQCFSMPYLGCREFAAAFSPPDGTERPVPWTESLGRMLLDIEYEPGHSGRGTPRFFDARIEEGVLRAPPRPVGWEVA